MGKGCGRARSGKPGRLMRVVVRVRRPFLTTVGPSAQVFHRSLDSQSPSPRHAPSGWSNQQGSSCASVDLPLCTNASCRRSPPPSLGDGPFGSRHLCLLASPSCPQPGGTLQGRRHQPRLDTPESEFRPFLEACLPVRTSGPLLMARNLAQHTVPCVIWLHLGLSTGHLVLVEKGAPTSTQGAQSGLLQSRRRSKPNRFP